MKMLITGAAGFLGHYLVDEFAEDYQVTALVRSKSKSNSRLNFVDKKFSVIEHDIRTPIDPTKFPKFDIILHCAGNPSAESSLQDPTSAVMDNVLGTLRLLEFAKVNPLMRFVYYSAGEVFGFIPKGTDSIETDSYNSLSAYSASKAAGEELCLAYHNSYKIPVSIIHISNTFGARSQPNRFPVIVVDKLLKGQPIKIHVGEDGEISGRKWLYAPDVARHTRLILEKQKTSCEKWNSSGVKFFANDNFARMIADILGIEPSFDYEIDRRPGHESYLSMSANKLYDHGLIDERSLEDKLKETVLWYKQNSNWLVGEF